VKLDQAIVLYLIKNHVVTLQGLGTFHLNTSVNLPAESEEAIMLPADAVTFDYNPKAQEDDGLIDFIVAKLKKIKPLASADLDSFITLGKQFLNIGKPFTITGLGTLEKTQAAKLEFKPGQFITPKIEAPKALKENENEVSSGLFNDSQRKPPPNYDRRILSIIGAVILLIMISWAVYYFGFRKEKKPETITSTVTDSATTKTDTLSHAVTNDTTAKPATDLGTPLTNAMSSFAVVIKDNLEKHAAERRQRQLISQGHSIITYADDSLHYKIAELYTRPLADTIQIKDSLKRYYGNNTYIEMK
jgi:nucleoid DNA-binding protein